MICRLFILRSSPPPSLRLDHRVGSNGVKHQTHFLSHEQSVVAFSKVHLFKLLMGIFLTWPRFNLSIGAINVSYIVQMITILDQSWINQFQAKPFIRASSKASQSSINKNAWKSTRRCASKTCKDGLAINTKGKADLQVISVINLLGTELLTYLHLESKRC